MTLLIGTTLGHYRITAHLGEGGMGVVYRATDSRLDREVAIKVLPAAFAADPERMSRFQREARMLAALEHPNVAQIHGLEEIEGQQLLVMQLAPGETLAARLERGPMPLEEALRIVGQIAEGLESAHEKGIVHRDLKPANVMVAPPGSVKLLDFGLAKAWEDPVKLLDFGLAKAWEDPAEVADASVLPTLTAGATGAGVILGTAAYMSPEQARGQPVDRRSDIWSFGVVLHELLTGERLFAADTVSDSLARVLMAELDWDRLRDGKGADGRA